MARSFFTFMYLLYTYIFFCYISHFVMHSRSLFVNFSHYYELSHNCCVISKVHYEVSILNIAMIFMPYVPIIEFIVT
jgi:hypothetical protein